MEINHVMGHLPQMENADLDPFVKGLEIAMAADGWKMKPLSEKARLGDSAIRDLFRKASSPKISTAIAISNAMGRTIDEIITMGQTGSPSQPEESPKQRAGFAETATPYSLQEYPATDDEPQPGLRRIFGQRARSPATLLVARDYPGFAIHRGDVVVLDLSRLPNPGEVCAVQINQGTTTTDLRRYLPPCLIDAGTDFAIKPQSVDDPTITIKNPVIGLLRGLPVNKE